VRVYLIRLAKEVGNTRQTIHITNVDIAITIGPPHHVWCTILGGSCGKNQQSSVSWRTTTTTAAATSSTTTPHQYTKTYNNLPVSSITAKNSGVF
jgi:hypothetical protein